MSEHPQTVRAEQFQVVDADGHTRVVLGIRNGQPAFELLRADGSIGVSISLSKDQTPNIIVRDQKGRTRVEIRLYDEGEGEYPSIALTGYDGRTRAYMTVTPHNYGEVGVVDDNRGTVLLNECG